MTFLWNIVYIELPNYCHFWWRLVISINYLEMKWTNSIFVLGLVWFYSLDINTRRLSSFSFCVYEIFYLWKLVFCRAKKTEHLHEETSFINSERQPLIASSASSNSTYKSTSVNNYTSGDSKDKRGGGKGSVDGSVCVAVKKGDDVIDFYVSNTGIELLLLLRWWLWLCSWSLLW